eukprot:CAMPEP_0171306762 /NCGR_PEP_ID=MMETSP0816-20121228/16802_1 /TAXON_ID=420281 /ORGANISM="Proboscia inermis, Strain CCAP1064/1" /LENGTH=298 /DNA_ID=CAMNT_0011788563 /DNA_START=505 /DNA_END=1401 /DNA_ORIENTATION=+
MQKIPLIWHRDGSQRKNCRSPSNAFNRKSDMQCVEYDALLHRIIYGHRNGSVSVVDDRSGYVVCNLDSSWVDKQSTSPSFGCASSVKSLSAHNGPNQVLVKGSFGSCHLFDLRKVGGCGLSPRGTGCSYTRNHAMLFQMPIPPDFNTDTVASGKYCSGLAIDSLGLTAISPFVGLDSKNRLESFFGFWSLSKGIFLDSIPITRYIESTPVLTSSGMVQEEEGPHFLNDKSRLYCELSSTTTCAIQWENIKSVEDCENKTAEDFFVKELDGFKGVWFKSGMPISERHSFSGIHHAAFPG